MANKQPNMDPQGPLEKDSAQPRDTAPISEGQASKVPADTPIANDVNPGNDPVGSNAAPPQTLTLTRKSVLRVKNAFSVSFGAFQKEFTPGADVSDEDMQGLGGSLGTRIANGDLAYVIVESREG